MTSLLSPKRLLTEMALKQLSWAESDLSGSQLAIPLSSRHGPGLLGPGSPELVRQHATVLRLVSVVEAYIDALSAELMDEYLPAGTPVLVRVLEDFGVANSTAWERRKTAYRSYHGIDLEKRASWTAVSAAIEARNSVAHGLGRLTPLQLRKKARIETLLRGIAINIVDNELHTSAGTLTAVRDSCRDFVRDVDNESA